MENNFVIISDSAMDMPYEFVKENKIEVIPMDFAINNKEYLSYLDNRDLSYDEFYMQMKKGSVNTTSQISIHNTIKAYEHYLNEGMDILGIVLSSSLSGSHNSVRLAVRALQKKYQDRKIYVIDSNGVSSGEGLLVWYANKFKNEGKTLEETYKLTMDLIPKICHWFTVQDIKVLQKSGRLTKDNTSSNVTPVLHLNEQGKITVVYRKIGKRQALRAIINSFEKNRDKNYDQVIITHSECDTEAKFIEEEIKLIDPNISVLITNIGPIIGTHVGPGSIGLFYIGNKR